MPILFDLPTDVALSILMDWLGDTKSLVALDSASARSIRWAYLGLVRDPRLLLEKALNFCGKANDIRYWISTRGVRFQGMIVSAPELKEAIRVNYECLTAVTSLTVSCTGEESFEVEEFRILLRLLPSLTSLDMSDFVLSDDDDYLVVLSTMRHLSLRSLKLDNDTESLESINLLLCCIGSTLEVLHAGVDRWLDIETLNQLAAKCYNVKELRVSCDDMTPDVLASAFGPDKFPLLEVIDLEYHGNDATPINDEFALTLCPNHINLTTVIAETGSEITLASVATALTHCPRFLAIVTTLFEFNMVDNTYDAYETAEPSYYSLSALTSLALAADSRASFQAITSAPLFKHKVREIDSQAAHKYSNDEVAEMINSFGKSIGYLRISLGADVSHLTLQRLFRECTALRTLYLEECASCTDDLVMMLADNCHHVHSLSLAGAVNITNMSVCYLLQRIGQRLVNLYIEQCQCLTNPTLITMVEYCPSLGTLNISGTGITVDAVITHLIKPNRLLKLVSLYVDPEMMTTLIDYVEKEENGANDRWEEVLEHE